MVKNLRLGDKQKLAVELTLDQSPPSAVAELGWGWLRVWLAGQCVWCQSVEASAVESEIPAPVCWTWVDLLHGLARIWPWLRLEEGYPLTISPEHPGKLLDVAEARWRDLAQGQAEAEEDELFDFRQRHDLSLLLRGIALPPLWWVKEGGEAVLWSPECPDPVRISQKSALAMWEEIGDFLHAALVDAEAPRAVEAIRRWQGREQAVTKHFLPVATGMDWSALAELAGTEVSDDIAGFLGYGAESPVVPDSSAAIGNELLMAARMTTGYVGVEYQRQILLAIKQLPYSVTPELDALMRCVPEFSSEIPAWQQGYDLAHWLRQQMQIAPETLIKPEQWLQEWNVAVQSMELPVALDALAVWGPTHGPAIIYNTHSLSRSATLNGRRTALAHEICHLLVDREGALPVAEVLRGASPRWAEKRANAFAAELLLPREQVATAVVGSADMLAMLSQLEKNFQVSRELICHQLFNSRIGSQLSHDERQRLESWKRV